MVDSSAETKNAPKNNPACAEASAGRWVNLAQAQAKLLSLFEEILEDPGFGELHVNVRIMKDARKEVILCSGKEYRFVLSQATSMADEKRIV